MKLLLSLFFTAVLAVGAFAQSSYKLAELDSVEVVVLKPGKVDPKKKNYQVKYTKSEVNPLGWKENVGRMTEPLDSAQLEKVAQSYKDDIQCHHYKGAAITAELYNYLQEEKGVRALERVYQSIKGVSYTESVWRQHQAKFMGNWIVVVGADIYKFKIDHTGEVFLEGVAVPKNTKKTKLPRMELLTDVRFVLDNVIGGKVIIFDFVAQNTFYSFETGYIAQKLQ